MARICSGCSALLTREQRWPAVSDADKDHFEWYWWWWNQMCPCQHEVRLPVPALDQIHILTLLLQVFRENKPSSGSWNGTKIGVWFRDFETLTSKASTLSML